MGQQRVHDPVVNRRPVGCVFVSRLAWLHGRVDTLRALFVTAVVLLAIPLACALALLSVYALLFVLHGVSLLF